MVKKKVDDRVRGLIESCVRKNHRSFFVLVGDYGKDQVENLHRVLSKTRIKARPSVLWCYKKELGFSTHKKKRMREIKRDQRRGLYDPEKDDAFDLFISSTDIRWCYYKDTDKVLGQTFGMCVLQDFEAITPNLLARTVETVEGGGVVILLLKTVKSLKQLYTMSMDVHNRFRTESHYDVIPRFNERFILSLADCSSCLVLDDELNILPLSSTVKDIPGSTLGLRAGEADLSGHGADQELVELRASLEDTPHVGALVALAKTVDQAQSVMSFLDAISQKSIRSTVSLTAGRGRGKSAAIGMCLAGAISYGYSNVFVTAPSVENVGTLFEFIVKGLVALKFVEHSDFELLQEHIGEGKKVTTRVNVFRGHRQTIQYIEPHEVAKLSQAELVAIDEAAAIPLPIVKNLLGPYLVFLSSTINGYEGTGRSLSLKLIQQLRKQQHAQTAAAAIAAGGNVAGSKKKKGERKVHEERWQVMADTAGSSGRTLTELTLETPIRYHAGDAVEMWLNKLLCLDVDSAKHRIVTGIPPPDQCELYQVNRDALFSYHNMAEGLLQRIWSLYTSAHYKNTPNDLQMLSDAPAHRLFVLLAPRSQAKVKAEKGAVSLPDVLCVIQVAFEGGISRKSAQAAMARAHKASGDMIPWVISQQFSDTNFPTLSGARIVRVATHPDVQGMGYGSQALKLLLDFFEGRRCSGVVKQGNIGIEKMVASTGSQESSVLLTEEVTQRKELPPLLINVADVPREQLDWVGVSFGLTHELLKFWSRVQFRLCYLRQTRNELTGEHSAVMLRTVSVEGENSLVSDSWLREYVNDYRRRVVSLLSSTFRDLEHTTALNLIDPDSALSGSEVKQSLYGTQPLSAQELTEAHLTHYDMRRVEVYVKNMADHHSIGDLVPLLARLFFLGRMPTVRLSALQLVIFLCVGLQLKDIDQVVSQLDTPANQVLAFFRKIVHKISGHMLGLVKDQLEEESMPSRSRIEFVEDVAAEMKPKGTDKALQEDQADDEQAFLEKQKEMLLQEGSISKHRVKADSKTLEKALKQSLRSQGDVQIGRAHV